MAAVQLAMKDMLFKTQLVLWRHHKMWMYSVKNLTRLKNALNVMWGISSMQVEFAKSWIQTASKATNRRERVFLVTQDST